MTTLEDDPLVAEPELDPGSESQFDWEWRVMAVATAWVFPGVVGGALLRLCLPDGGPVEWWLGGGAAIAGSIGGLLEADYFT